MPNPTCAQQRQRCAQKQLDVPNKPNTAATLVVVPAFGASHLTDQVLADLTRDDLSLVPNLRIVVVDNKGDYQLPETRAALSVHRPGGNTRWIGAANWGLRAALEADDDIFVVLNNDTRLSRDFVYWLGLSLVENDGAALAASCYDDSGCISGSGRRRPTPSNSNLEGPTVPFRSATARRWRSGWITFVRSASWTRQRFPGMVTAPMSISPFEPGLQVFAHWSRNRPICRICGEARWTGCRGKRPRLPSPRSSPG